MKSFVINNLDMEGYGHIITLLNYESKISDCLQSIKVSSFTNMKVLVDTALCSGLNQYRFIATTLYCDGTININEYKYVNVNPSIIETANAILLSEPLSLNNSILTTSQINSLKNSSNFLVVK